ncbi:MAG TPA: hypothetical protein VFZ62_00250 [Candidatus Saccharimonadales bacterium]
MKRNDVFGWVGVIMILIAFTLTTLEIIHPKTLVYGLLNFVGALGIIISSYTKKDFQPVALNIIWLIVAAIGIVKALI